MWDEVAKATVDQKGIATVDIFSDSFAEGGRVLFYRFVVAIVGESFQVSLGRGG